MSKLWEFLEDFWFYIKKSWRIIIKNDLSPTLLLYLINDVDVVPPDEGKDMDKNI